MYFFVFILTIYLLDNVRNNKNSDYLQKQKHKKLRSHDCFKYLCLCLNICVYEYAYTGNYLCNFYEPWTLLSFISFIAHVFL